MANSWQAPYDTGWIARSLWANKHLGSSTTKNLDSNLTHNLNAPLSKLRIMVLISTDGADGTSFEVAPSLHEAGVELGWVASQVDANNVIIQSGEEGALRIATNGVWNAVASDDWFYKVRVYLLG